MTYGAKPSIAVPSPERYVRNALATLGRSRRNTGYWSHAIQVDTADHLCPGTQRISLNQSASSLVLSYEG